MIIILLLSLFQLPVQAALSNNQTSHPELLKLSFKEHQDNIIHWQIDINNGQQIIQNQQLKLTLSGSHHLDETALISELQRYNIGLNKTSDSNVFILDIPKTLTNAIFNISTIDESKESDNTIQIAGIIDGTSVISKDIQHHYQEVPISFNYSDTVIDKPITTVQLVNHDTQEVVSELINRSGQNSLIFENIRVYDDDNQKIDYEIKVKAPDTYTVETKQFDVNIDLKDTEDGDEQTSIELPSSENPATEEVTTETPTTENPTTEPPTTKHTTSENPTTEAPTTENKTTEMPSTEAPASQEPTIELATTESPLVDTSSEPAVNRSIIFKPSELNSMNIMTLDAVSSTYKNVPSSKLVTIATGSGYMTMQGQMSADQKSITWKFTLDYQTAADKPVWLSKISVSNGLTLPSNVTYSFTNGGKVYRSGTLPIETTAPPTLVSSPFINLGRVYNKDLVTITFVTPVTIPNLNNYTLSIGNLVYDEIGYKYSRDGISNTVTRVSTTPTINTVSYLDRVVTGAASPGETVTIKNSSGTILGSVVADSTGTYRVTITPQAVGTILSATAKGSDTVQSDPVTTVVTGVFTFNLQKINQQGFPLQGATIKLTGNGQTYEMTSTATGDISFNNLKPGTYSLTEITAPSGYILDSAVHTVIIDNDGNIQVDGATITGAYQFVNKPIVRNIQVSVYDAISNSPLQGATYQLFDDKNNLLQTVTSDSAGKVQFTNLPYGTYKIVQTKTLPGYQLSTATQTVTINNGDVSVISPQYKVMLPDTGGIGSLLFIISGSLLISISLIIRRKI
ncbi:carboxypeptidase regulatory-like domain-containing protein [Macrococcoides canis]|uniref:SpaA isopeptide-forming pilin-related protein n=1 Tax=Macrococcoides canis TaxID=1855823 RepID=UPI00207C2D91|nr:SpaA isopeptide-forming pilin-related protein [Macrococcus canis]MCO4097596.1 carboxypeptidase regulatory-like domain-containing protein [Macrococcus canis]UTH09734.1 carboxypeptidase regulatory-like domain-containing protein [Macrococcus canis]